MPSRFVLSVVTAAAVLLFVYSPDPVRAQGKAASAKNLRCTFTLNATGTWNKDGSPTAQTKPSQLLLRFDSINTDEGTAVLRNGTTGSEIVVQQNGGNLHLIQSFRSGPFYLTTVFDKETAPGKLKAVHTRHEYFSVPLEGSTSSPEQYYGECEIFP